MSPWGWRPERTQGIWKHGALWLKPLVLVSPWATLVLGLMLMYVVGETLTSARGVLFDLPDSGMEEGASTSLVALVMPLHRETTVFFDDGRYVMDDLVSETALGEQLSERVARTSQKTLLVLADRRIPCGDLARFAKIAKVGGVEKVLFACRRNAGEETPE